MNSKKMKISAYDLDGSKLALIVNIKEYDACQTPRLGAEKDEQKLTSTLNKLGIDIKQTLSGKVYKNDIEDSLKHLSLQIPKDIKLLVLCFMGHGDIDDW